MSRDSRLVPLLRQLVTHLPGKFDSDERLQHWHTRKLDAIGMFVMFILYVWVSWTFGPEYFMEENAPLPAFLCQTFVAIMALYNLYVEFYILPRGSKDAEDDFNVTYGPFGRWVYLTHQTIGALAIHSVVSLLSPFGNARLAGGTYAATPVVGAAGIFVTIQYFNLVFPNSDHKKICRLWAERGVRFGFIDSMRHALPVVVVVLDVLAKQKTALLFAMPSVCGIIGINMLYVVAFLCLTHVNYAITGHWQYSFMKALGQSAQKWCAFACVQGSILSACGLSIFLLARLVTLW